MIFPFGTGLSHPWIMDCRILYREWVLNFFAVSFLRSTWYGLKAFTTAYYKVNALKKVENLLCKHCLVNGRKNFNSSRATVLHKNYKTFRSGSCNRCNGQVIRKSHSRSPMILIVFTVKWALCTLEKYQTMRYWHLLTEYVIE